MRRWGYGLAGLLAIALFAGLANPSETQVESSAIQSTTSPAPSIQQTESAEPTTSQDEPVSENSSAVESAEESVSEPEAAEPRPTQTVGATEPEPSEFSELLRQLVIADEYPNGYDRDLFRHWVDDDRDGCNARREVLKIEAVEAPVVGSECELIGGLWYSAYDGVITDDDGEFDIDHMVPLKEAWDSGAHAWDSDRRRAFANDLDLPQALIAVSRSSNRSKSDRDPADWLPSLTSYHCQYIQDWIVVKIKWELSVDAREFAALRSVASGCESD